MACQIIEDYAREYAHKDSELMIATVTVSHVSNLMETSGMTEQQACEALKISQMTYKEAKELLKNQESSEQCLEQD